MLYNLFTQGCFVTLLIFTASAAPRAHANTGTVNFSGSVSEPTCTVSASGRGSGNGNGMQISLGDVRINDITSGIWQSVNDRAFVLAVTCPGNMAGYTRARVTFNAPGGSGVDPDDTRMLKLTGASTARGVAVGLYLGGQGTPLNMNAAPSVTGNFTVSGGNSIARINMHAQYKRTPATPNPGSAFATLPLTMTYE